MSGLLQAMSHFDISGPLTKMYSEYTKNGGGCFSGSKWFRGRSQ